MQMPARFSPTIALLTAGARRRGRGGAHPGTARAQLRKFGILGHISATPGLSLSDLARRSGILVQSVHTMIGSLTAAGLSRVGR